MTFVEHVQQKATQTIRDRCHVGRSEGQQAKKRVALSYQCVLPRVARTALAEFACRALLMGFFEDDIKMARRVNIRWQNGNERAAWANVE